MMRKILLLTASLALGSMLAACSVLPAPAVLPQLHDFGQLPTAQGDAIGPIRLGRVTAPAWLDDGAIHYRLLYGDSTLLRSYADHRWVAAPSEMLGLRLQYLLQAIAPAGGKAGSEYVLDGELLEFEQDFSSGQQAEAKLVLQVSLRSASDGRLVSQKLFSLSLQTSADVQGAVGGMAKLAEQAGEQVTAWCSEAYLGDKPTAG